MSKAFATCSSTAATGSSDPQPAKKLVTEFAIGTGPRDVGKRPSLRNIHRTGGSTAISG